MPSTKTAPPKRKDAATKGLVASDAARTTRIRYTAIGAVIVVVGLAIGLAIGFSSSSTPKKSNSNPVAGLRADLREITKSAATTEQIYATFQRLNSSCTTALCVSNAAFNSIGAEGVAANLVHQTYFPQTTEATAQVYVNTLIGLQDVYEYIGRGTTMKVVESYQPDLRKDMAKMRTASHKIEGLL